jgi:predicted RNase H-like HicB family nuclease
VVAVRIVYEQDESGAWIVHVAEEPRAHTYGRSLRQARSRIKEVIDIWWDDPHRFVWTEEIQLPTPAQHSWESAREARQQLQEAQVEYEKATRVAVEQLRDAGLPLRDIGDLLNLSHQRIAQIAEPS